MDTKNQGTVKFFNSEKGFGFIKHDEAVSATVDDLIVPTTRNGDKRGLDLAPIRFVGHWLFP